VQQVNTTRIQVEEISAQVDFKAVKNLNLRIKAPGAHVYITAPRGADIRQVRDFLISRLEWVRRTRSRILNAASDSPAFPQSGAVYSIWGWQYTLLLVERERPASVKLRRRSMIMSVRPGTGPEKRQALLEKWFREQVKHAARELVDKWSRIMRVQVNKIFVQSMKTKWGSCNMVHGNIRLNTDLVHHQPECLEYLVIHELVHLLESNHNERFYAIMDKFYPHWRKYRTMLNG